MNGMRVIAPACLAAALSGAVIAGDAEEIRKATIEHMERLNSGDVEGHLRHHLGRHSAFRAEGQRLVKTATLDEQREELKALFARGFKSRQELRDLQVEVFGDAAVVTAYVTGSVTLPSGKTQAIAERRTAVLVKQGGEWKEVHLHASPLAAPLD